MLLDKSFADFISKEIEKHVRAGMQAVEKRVGERIDALIIDIKKIPGIDDVQPMIKELIETAIAEIPAAKDGVSVTADDVQPMIKELIETAIAEIPAAKDGVSPKVEDIAKAIEDIVLGKHSQWLLERERMENDRIEKRLAEIPAPKDGKNAFELEDINLDLADNGRDLTIKFVRGEESVVKNIKLPSIVDRGVFRENETYEKGDGVTFAGSYWISQKDLPEEKPGIGSDWRLAIKRGRDAKEVIKSEPVKKTVSIKDDK